MLKALIFSGCLLFASFALIEEVSKDQIILDAFLENESKLSNSYKSQLNSLMFKSSLKQSIDNRVNLIESVLNDEPYSNSSFQKIKLLADSNQIELPSNLPNLTLAYHLIGQMQHPTIQNMDYEQKLLIENIEEHSNDSVSVKIGLFHDFKSNGLVNIYDEGKSISIIEAQNLEDISNLTGEIVNHVTGKIDKIRNR